MSSLVRFVFYSFLFCSLLFRLSQYNKFVNEAISLEVDESVETNLRPPKLMIAIPYLMVNVIQIMIVWCFCAVMVVLGTESADYRTK